MRLTEHGCMRRYQAIALGIVLGSLLTLLLLQGQLGELREDRDYWETRAVQADSVLVYLTSEPDDYETER